MSDWLSLLKQERVAYTVTLETSAMFIPGGGKRTSYTDIILETADWGKRKTYYTCISDWTVLPSALRKPMPCKIFKRYIKKFLIAKYV